jgi:hypothetical protein
LVECDGENLVFLFSTPRAGSTLTSAILATHPDVCCPNEPWFLLGLASLYQGGNITYARYEHSGVERALREFLSESEFLEATRSFALSAYNQSLARENKRIFIDKTPRYFHIVEFIDRLFPRAKKVWLKRNPLDVAASYQKSWNIPVEKLFDPGFGPMAFDLPLGPRRLGAFFQGQPQTLEVFYEDLVQRPTETTRQLCEFINVDYIDGMERYGSDPRALERRKRLSMGDTNIFAHSEPHSQSIGQWERSLSNDQIQMILNCLGRQVLQRMGYPQTIERVISLGFWFPGEDTVADNVSAFVNAAKWLPWVSR